MRGDRTNRPAWLGYAAAVFAVAVGAAARHALFNGPGAHGPYVTFFPAVCIAALFGGFFPGLLATALSVAYNLISWDPVSYPVNLPVLFIFVGTGIFIAFFASVLTRAERRAHEADKKAALAAEREQAALALQESRKASEELLRESEREFAAMFERAAVGKSLSDPATRRMLRVNQAFADMLGYEVEDLCGKSFVDITHPEDHEKDLTGYDKVRDGTADKWQYEKRYIRKDGSILWADVSGNIIRYEDGRPERTIAVIQDITQRKHMEEELRNYRLELEERVRKRTAELVRANDELRNKTEIIDFAHDAILIRDMEGRIAFWNIGARETYGFDSDRALGQIAHKLLQSVFPVPLEEITGIVLAKGEWKGEVKQTRANGESMIVDSRWAIQVGKEGQPVGFLEVNRDITEKKIVDEKLRKADRAFRTLSAFNQAMVRQTDEMELLQQLCRIVAEVGGYRLVWVGFARNDEKKSVVPVASAGDCDEGYLARADISWADGERGRGPCGVSIRTGKPAVSQNSETNPAFAPWRREAVQRGIASSISLPLIVEGTVIGAIGIYASEPDAFDPAESDLLNDLAQNLSYGIASIRSEQKRRDSEEALRVYAARLELINRELQEFAFAAAHDLQEPLRKVQTFCDLAIRRSASSLDSTSREYLDKVVKSTSRMRALLHDMLQFSRVAENPVGPFKTINLSRIVREAADVFEVSIKETGCRMMIEQMPAIEADESQMSRLFQNLLANALKFRAPLNPRIRVYTRSEIDGFCEICVEDNGIGFDQQFAEQIFKPFERLHGRGGYEGTGMGLAICRKIAERHCGTISVESREGVGSTFILRLPVKQSGVECGAGAQ